MNILDNLPSIVSLPIEYRDSPHSERHHREVIYLLEKKLTSNPKCVQSLREWITSYHELASIHQQKGDLETAPKNVCSYRTNLCSIWLRTITVMKI